MRTRLLVAVLLTASWTRALAQTEKVPLQAKKQPKAAKAAAASAPEATPPGPALPAGALKALKARSIGPAVMGGRVSDIALDPENPYVFYVGLGTGGVLKTSNDGTTFEAVFEKESVASIGAVAVAPSNSKIVWVGTGEANDRNSSGWGNGVSVSTDSGGTWAAAGLSKSRAIARIVVSPKDPGTAWVCATGDLWQPGGERGVYKTGDGGKTWQAVLQAPAPHAAKAGCGDLALSPDGETLYAAMYARQRTPWSFVSGPSHTGGADVGGIFRSGDGGATWKKLDKGLPGSTGRIGLDVFRKDPKIVYAIVQSDEGGSSPIRDNKSKRGGVFRSTDAGDTWTRMSALNPRPFYFSQIRVDPANDKRIYVMGVALHVSDDGGSSFREDLFGNVHPDCHAMAIDPRNPKRVLLGTDGGVYASFEGGKNWAHLDRFAGGEFYRVAVDDGTPYRIAGGLQDNLNWVGPSATRTKDGIVNSDWINIGGGDGFYCVFDPKDRNIVYAESQAGNVHRFNLASGATKDLRPEPAEGQAAFRFHWCAPLIGSAHEPGALYLGGNRVFKLTAKGEEWKAISPDLSTQDPSKTTSVGSGAENYGVVYTLAESPVEKGLLWAGTDDGKLWLTANGGETWTDLSANVPLPARGQWVSRVEASSRDAAVAYLAVDAHRAGNDAPLAYRTSDRGKTWTSVAGNLPASGPVKVVREDSKNARLLFAGTELGLFASMDQGGSWAKLGELPTVAVDDILVHPRERDLVVATHGRSLYVIDDISALEALSEETSGKDAWLFPPRPAHGFNPLPGWADWNGKAAFRGENPPEGAILTYWVKDFTGEGVKIAITNAADQPVATLKAAGTPGLGRLVWDLRPSKENILEYGGEGKKFVRAGDYTVTLTYGKTKVKQKLTVTIAEGIETR